MREFPAAMTTASRRGRTLVSLLALAGAAAAPACKLDQHGVVPPLDRVYYPGSALVDPDGLWLYVANSNSDLRYNNGTLVAVDLEAAMRDRFGAPGVPAPTWQLCPGADRVRLDTDPEPCCWDYLDHETLNCDDRLYIPPDSTITMGSFAAGMQFQPFTEPACNPNEDAATATSDARSAAKDRHDCNANCPSDPVAGRLYIGVRGNSTLTYVDTNRVYDGGLALTPGGPGRYRPVFSCPNGAASGEGACVVSQTNPGPMPPAGDVTTPIPVPDEPYALALDPTLDLLYVGNLQGDTTHPQTGGISLFDVARPTLHAAPTFLGPSSSFFNPDGNGNFGITSLTLHNGDVYACSRFGTNVVNVVPSFGALALCATDNSDDVSLVAGSDVFTTPLVGAEIRGIQFVPEMQRAFVLQRVPPALVGFDTSTSAEAFGNFPSEVLETCSAPTFLQAYDSGEGTRLYVTCFDAGQIYVFDPSVPRLISVINAGGGPAGLAFPSRVRPDHALAYIVGFGANDIPVVDLTPGSETQYHVVQRIGFPSLVPR